MNRTPFSSGPPPWNRIADRHINDNPNYRYSLVLGIHRAVIRKTGAVHRRTHNNTAEETTGDLGLRIRATTRFKQLSPGYRGQRGQNNNDARRSSSRKTVWYKILSKWIQVCLYDKDKDITNYLRITTTKIVLWE